VLDTALDDPADPSREAPSPRPAPVDVTIVAHDIGAVGGMERVLSELVLGLRALGHRVTVIARTCELPDSEGVTFRRVRGPRRPFVIAYPWFAIFGSIAVRRWRRGVVQATGAIVLNRVDVVSVHYCHQVGQAHASRVSGLSRGQLGLVRLMKPLGERLGFRRNARATFVCVSAAVAEEVRTHYPRLRDRIVTISNGVDTERFAPGPRHGDASAMRARLNIEPDALVAAFVGSEWKGKGLASAIEALAHAPRWSLIVAGDGDRPTYQALADSLGVAHAVRWLGVTPDVDVVYELADAFVFPSAYESFSLVTFEAAASALPILCAPVGGMRELIRDGENGFLITREPSRIAAALEALAADPQLRARMGRAAREAVLPFSWENTVAGHHELYERLAAHPQGRRRPRVAR
jgi:glycosyltransferase involved in cell wall biosynthesis